MFQVHYDRDWHFFEIVFYLIIGLFGGIYGLLITKFFFIAQTYRKKYLANYVIQETAVLAMITALLCYFNPFLTIDMTESMQILFRECDGEADYHGLCEANNRSSTAFALLYAVVVRSLLVIVSYGLKVPAGIFVPSMAIGAYFGRMVGIAVEALYSAHPSSSFFLACNGEEQCITSGTYAFLGAAAALSGIMNITVTVVVIMFELTGALTYILPTMIVVGITKIINSRFGKGGIADQAIVFNGMPFIDNKEEHDFGVNVSVAMTEDLTVFPAYGATLVDVENTLKDTSYGGFPIVEDKQSMTLTGYIGRTELSYAIARAKNGNELDVSALCFFTTSDQDPVQSSAYSRSVNNSTLFEAPNLEDVNGTEEVEMGLVLSRSKSPVFGRGPHLSVDTSRQSLPAAIDLPVSVPPPPEYDAEEFDLSSSTVNDVDAPQPERRGMHVDFAQFINVTPLLVNPKLPLEAVAEMFVRVGPRVILVAEQGKVVGLITQKDLLRYHYSNFHH